MRKAIVKKIGIFMLMFCLAMGTVPADFAAVTVSAAGTSASVKKGWVKEKAGWCYYVKGQKLKNTWKTINKKRYYFGADGARKQNCWYTTKPQGGTAYYSYYFNKSGVFVKKAGNYKKISTKLVNKMDTIIKRQKISSAKTEEAAVLAAFRYVRDKCGYDRLAARGFQQDNPPKNWEYDFAEYMLTKNSGSCYHYAAAMAFLVKRSTGLPVRICTGKAQVYKKGSWITSHGWVEVKLNGKWYTYDPIVADNKANRVNLSFSLCKLAPEKAAKYYKAAKRVTVNI